KVRVDHSILRLHVAALDPLRELDLVRRRQQRVASRLPEEELNAVAGLEAGLGALGGRGATLVIRAAPGSRLRACLWTSLWACLWTCLRARLSVCVSMLVAVFGRERARPPRGVRHASVLSSSAHHQSITSAYCHLVPFKLV